MDHAMREAETTLGDPDVPDRERLLSIFDVTPLMQPPATAQGWAAARGCPFLNAAVEVPDPDHRAHAFSTARTTGFAGLELMITAGRSRCCSCWNSRCRFQAPARMPRVVAGDLVPDRIDLAPDCGHRPDDVLLEGHEISDQRRYRHRRHPHLHQGWRARRRVGRAPRMPVAPGFRWWCSRVRPARVRCVRPGGRPVDLPGALLRRGNARGVRGS